MTNPSTGSCDVNIDTGSPQGVFFPYRVLSIRLTGSLQSQRDLYIAMRDLFIRHDRLSGDNVERLKKHIETTQSKLEGIRIAQKEGWEQEVDRLSVSIERDQASIVSLLNRLIFIRYS